MKGEALCNGNIDSYMSPFLIAWKKETTVNVNCRSLKAYLQKQEIIEKVYALKFFKKRC